MVVLGTHGRGGLIRFLLGSVAERTLRLARNPTLIVRHLQSKRGKERQSPALTHILCPVNFSGAAMAAFEHACSVARSEGARLTAVLAREQESVTPEIAKREEERLRAWLPQDPAVACEVKPMVRHGDAAEEVIALAREMAVDLVVMGAQHRRFADSTVLGVTTVRVTRHAPCPVLVVPRSNEASVW